MKKATLSFILLPVILFAQKENGTIKKYKMTGVGAQFGMVFASKNNVTQKDFQKIAPNSVLAFEYIDNYNVSNTLNPGFGLNSFVSIKKYNSESQNYNSNELRIGINFSQKNILALSSYSGQQGVVDSSIFYSTGQIQYSSPPIKKHYSIELSNQQTNLDIAYLFINYNEKRAMFYFGIGSDIGISWKRHIETTSVIETISQNSSANSPEKYNYNESFPLKNSWAASTYIPLGFNCKLGENIGEVQHCSVFLESRPFVSYNTVSELNKSYINIGLSIYAGAKFNF